MLTANDIHNKEFKRSFRGYDEDEIDEFLDQVVNDFDLLSRENVSLKADLARAEKTNEEYKQLKDDINNTLLMAQKTAADQMAAAKQAASEQRENTAKECQNMKREAEIAARKTVNDAQAEALQEAVAAKNGDDASADTKDAKADEADPSDGKDEKTSHGQWQPHAGASAQNRQDVQDR